MVSAGDNGAAFRPKRAIPALSLTVFLQGGGSNQRGVTICLGTLQKSSRVSELHRRLWSIMQKGYDLWEKYMHIVGREVCTSPTDGPEVVAFE